MLFDAKCCMFISFVYLLESNIVFPEVLKPIKPIKTIEKSKDGIKNLWLFLIRFLFKTGPNPLLAALPPPAVVSSLILIQN